jgi:eukaryotic-like serine/threonine-protein kinase
MPVSGQIVGGRFRLVRPLGEGGMATVWAAEHLTMGNLVAVKIISTELLDCELAITRFSREARAAAKLRSPYVVQLFDHDVDPVVGPYIAMELLEGESLAERLEREHTLSPKELCRILQQVSKGLMRAHAEGVVHRDIKPDNIFLAIDDEAEETAKILDFGVAKADSPFAVRTGNKTVAGALVGTLNYMSPEQAQGREVNHLTDLWALGVIAFECLVGKRPFEDEAPGAVVMQICAHPMAVPSSLNSDVPPGFDAWFAQACNRDPSLRFSSSQDLAQSLAHVCDAVELSLDDVLQEEPVGSDDVVTSAPVVAKSPARRKRRVLQLVDSTLPPPPDPAEEPDQLLSLDVEFEFEPEYYVAHGSSSVGPVSLETVQAGYRAGYVTIGSLLWTEGWPAWRRASEVFTALPGSRRKHAVPNLELVGPSCAVPSEAPALPAEPAASPKRRASSAPRRRASQKPVVIAPPPPPPPPPAHRASPLPPAPDRDSSSPPRRGASKPLAPMIPAPPPPPAFRVPSKRATTPVSEVRSAPLQSRSREISYYLTDGAITVGPVRASMLRTGLDAGKIPEKVVAWRQGWKDWTSVAELNAELEATPAAPLGMLRSRIGIEAVGLKCRMPPAAPAVAPNKVGRSKG